MDKWKFLWPQHLLRLLYINFRYNKAFDTKRLIVMDADIDISLGKKSRIVVPKGGCLDFGNILHKFSYQDKTKLLMEENSMMVFEKDWTVIDKGAVIYIAKNKSLFIGARSYISSNVKILAYNNISIGRDCIIADGVQIFAGDGHPVFQNGERINKDDLVNIGDNVWICSRAFILKGVNIGKGSVIAADAVVTKDVPPYSMVAGNPAKIVKQNIEWKENA